MNRIDFRSEYTAVAVISFALTFFVFLALVEASTLGAGDSAFITKVFLSVGIYLAIFKGILTIYNKYLWKYLGYRDIAIDGYWHYRSYKSTTQTNTEGYALVIQDMYGIQIHGFNIGSAGDMNAIAMWRTDNVSISRGTIFYDYELFAERPNRVSRVMKSRVTLNLYGKPPQQMVGTYIDLVIAAKDETIRSNLVGSVVFRRCELPELSKSTRELFDRMLIQKGTASKSGQVANHEKGEG